VRRIGVDIGSTEVRIAEVDVPARGDALTGRASLVAYAHAPVPRGAVQAGEVRDSNAVAQAIKRAYSAGKFSAKTVQVGIGTGGVMVREMELPSLPMDQLRTSLPFQVQEVLPMASDQALLDFYPTAEREHEGRNVLRGILVAAPKTIVFQNLLAIESAGLRPVMVDLNAFALMRSQMTSELSSETVAFVDIGSRITNVVITQAGMPRLVRTLPAGGQDVSDSLVSSLQVDIETADQRKMAVGMQGAPNAPADPAQPVIAEVVRGQVEAIRNTFVFYSSNNAGDPIRHVVLSGGGTLLPGLGQYLATATRLPVSFGNAFSRASVSKKVGRGAASGQETRAPIAVGLAFGEVS
jgi:type IV pilus assembly protein PilM